MLQDSANKNVLSCRLKAAWDDVLRIDSDRRLHAALRTWCVHFLHC